MTYSVKLYGDLSDDKERFHHELAAVLKIDSDRASALMQRVPVVILENAGKNQAERLGQELAAIRALYLIETDGEEAEPEPPPLIEALPEPTAASEDKPDVRRGYWGLGIMAAAVCLALIVGLVALTSQYRKIKSDYQPPPSVPKVAQPDASQTDTNTHHTHEQLVESLERISALELQIEELKNLIKLKEDELKAARVSPRQDMQMLRRIRKELSELKGQQLVAVNELKQLKGMVRKGAPDQSISAR